MSVTFSSESLQVFSVTFLICISWNTKCNVCVFLPGQLCWEYGKEVHYFTRGAGHVCHRLLHQEQSSVGFRNSQKRNSSCHCFKERYCGMVRQSELCFSFESCSGVCTQCKLCCLDVPISGMCTLTRVYVCICISDAKNLLLGRFFCWTAVSHLYLLMDFFSFNVTCFNFFKGMTLY